MSSWEGESNEYVYESFGTKGVDCRVVKWVKRGTLRQFGHVMRMKGYDFVKRMYCSGTKE